jgi:2-phosphosulfolactate phosphatase
MSSIQIRSIDVCLSPDLMHLFEVADRTVVVVDILRATSCMTTAFAYGVLSITPMAHLDECQAMKTRGYYTAGERNGEKVDGFDFGNSPFEYMSDELRGKKLAFTTTNGTVAIEKSKHALEVIIGSFLNLSAVAAHLKDVTNNILILCAGWKGKANLEDTLFAGALIHQLGSHVQPECDAPLMAVHLYQSAKTDMQGFLKNASHVKRLSRLHIERDIEFCLQRDKYDALPVFKEGVIVANQ